MLTAGIQGYHNDKINATESPKEMMINIISRKATIIFLNLKNAEKEEKEERKEERKRSFADNLIVAPKLLIINSVDFLRQFDCVMQK